MLAGYLACVTLGLVGYKLLKWQHDAIDRHARETMSPEAYESYVMSRGKNSPTTSQRSTGAARDGGTSPGRGKGKAMMNDHLFCSSGSHLLKSRNSFQRPLILCGG